MNRLKLEFKAGVCLLIARLLLLLPTRTWLRLLGWKAIETSLAPVPRVDSSEIARVEDAAHAVRSVAARVPWRADCLPQAIALMLLIGPVRRASQMLLGTSTQHCFEAHAWVVVGDQIVLGQGEAMRFAPVASVVVARTSDAR